MFITVASDKQLRFIDMGSPESRVPTLIAWLSAARAAARTAAAGPTMPT